MARRGKAISDQLVAFSSASLPDNSTRYPANELSTCGKVE